MPIHDAELASDQDSDLDYMPVEYEDFAFNAISLMNPARDDSALAETLTGDNEYSESAAKTSTPTALLWRYQYMRQATSPPHRLWTSIGTQPTDSNGGVVRLQEAPDLLIWTKTCPAQEFVDQVTDILDAFLIMAYHYAEFATPNQRDLQELIVLAEEAVEEFHCAVPDSNMWTLKPSKYDLGNTMSTRGVIIS